MLFSNYCCLLVKIHNVMVWLVFATVFWRKSIMLLSIYLKVSTTIINFIRMLKLLISLKILFPDSGLAYCTAFWRPYLTCSNHLVFYWLTIFCCNKSQKIDWNVRFNAFSLSNDFVKKSTMSKFICFKMSILICWILL